MYISGKDVTIKGTELGLDIMQADSFSANIDVQSSEIKPLGKDPFELPTGVKVTGSISGAMLDKGVTTVLGLKLDDPFKFAQDLNNLPDLKITATLGSGDHAQTLTFNHVLIKKIGFSVSGDGNVKVDVDFTANPEALTSALASAGGE